MQQCTQRGHMVSYGTLRMVGRQAICKWSCSHRPTSNNNSIFKTNNEYPLKRRVGLGKVAAMHMLFEGDESVLSYDQQSNSGQACLNQHTGWNSGEVHGRTQAGGEGASASTTTSINITRGESWGTKPACDVAGWTHFHSNTTPTYARPPPDHMSVAHIAARTRTASRDLQDMADKHLEGYGDPPLLSGSLGFLRNLRCKLLLMSVRRING